MYLSINGVITIIMFARIIATEHWGFRKFFYMVLLFYFAKCVINFKKTSLD